MLKKEMGLGYRKVKKVPRQGNSQRCLVLRQQYALKMLELLDQGKRVINVDETWISETGYHRFAWAKPQISGSVPLNTVTPSLSMIAALDTDGNVYYALSHATTDQGTFMLFLRHLTA